MHTCHTCRETPGVRQVKGGCGHLVYVCDDCMRDLNIIRHEKCITCKGGKTPDEEDAELVAAHNDSLDSMWDDDFEEALPHEDLHEGVHDDYDYNLLDLEDLD